MNSSFTFLVFTFFIFISPLSFAKSLVKLTPAPKGAKAYIISPKNGETVTSPVRVVFVL
ncbi:MAG: hypothetical protein KDD34_01820 [Bdellovibrionales bacterium]|nr:hypothetical protein [Bdellovibrionales bacterium]